MSHHHTSASPTSTTCDYMYMCHTLLCAYSSSFVRVVLTPSVYAKRSPLAISGEFKTKIHAFVLGLGSNVECIQIFLCCSTRRRTSAPTVHKAQRTRSCYTHTSKHRAPTHNSQILLFVLFDGRSACVSSLLVCICMAGVTGFSALPRHSRSHLFLLFGGVCRLFFGREISVCSLKYHAANTIYIIP